MSVDGDRDLQALAEIVEYNRCHLRYVAEHLSKRPENQKLLIIISDGQPADYGYIGTEAEADLRGIKKEYSKKGIILFAAAIGESNSA